MSGNFCDAQHLFRQPCSSIIFVHLQYFISSFFCHCWTGKKNENVIYQGKPFSLHIQGLGNNYIADRFGLITKGHFSSVFPFLWRIWTYTVYSWNFRGKIFSCYIDYWIAGKLKLKEVLIHRMSHPFILALEVNFAVYILSIFSEYCI